MYTVYDAVEQVSQPKTMLNQCLVDNIDLVSDTLFETVFQNGVANLIYYKQAFTAFV